MATRFVSVNGGGLLNLVDRLKNIAKLASDIQHVETAVGKSGTETYPPYYRTPRTLGKEIDEKKLAGEYCYISSEHSSKEKNFSGTCSRTQSYYVRRDGECLEDFASKFANIGDEIPKPQSNSHSFEGRKFDTWVELEGLNETNIKTRVIRTEPEKVIDYCTCMICVKGIFYHCSDEDDDIADHVCSCAGSKGNVFKRWTCLSILACLMPCLFCYLPAKGCLTLCRKCRSKDKRSGDSNLRAKFKKPNERRLKETTTLLMQ